MFEVRYFHLGKVKGLFLGLGSLLRRFLRFQVAAPGIFLPIYIRWEPRVGLVRTTESPRLAAFELTTGLTWDTYIFLVRALALSQGLQSDWLCSGSPGGLGC